MPHFPVVNNVAIFTCFCSCLMGCQHAPNCFDDNLRPVSIESRSSFLFPWSNPIYTGGDGTSLDQAVSFEGISVFFIASKVKKSWIDLHYPSSTIRGVLTQIVQGRVIDTITIQTSSEEVMQVYFDVTSTVLKPGVGLWFFVGTDGVQCGGMITEEYLRGNDSEPWQETVGQGTGVLLYQIDDYIGDGMLAIGHLRHGKMHGVWHYERQHEGAVDVEYDMGTTLKRIEDTEMLWSNSLSDSAKNGVSPKQEKRGQPSRINRKNGVSPQESRIEIQKLNANSSHNHPTE